MAKLFVVAAAAFAAATSFLPTGSFAQDQPQPGTSCPVDHDRLADILKKSVKPGGGPSNGGLDNNEWAAVVNRQGIVCAVAYSGSKIDDQWLGSRAIAAEKANTANAFSLKDKAIATANLYAGAQPGGFLFGAALGNPPSPEALYAGTPEQFGTSHDPMVGKPIGGTIVFGGGLALYDGNGIAGALGVSGDSSCADHNVAWRVRHQLGLDRVPAGVSPNMKDAIIYDIGPDGKSPSGFGHPKCNGKEDQIAVDLGAGVSGNVVR
ncbi:GlcG/HbpS family heme-binding protein [Bradyrhizobium sp. 195]|uniref:GlcG/HbpS family heme-binding protein n=1 Tax=Bradyrhizobium sp. 195 TaxID=2782662 RepID=UPI00200166C9|nr:heme-binding protein [Bradyrhizobium sp. 195]UPK31414.1 heme-binding protein [Bradyrhizobium sp. 195]